MKSPVAEALFASLRANKTEKNYELPVAKSQITFSWLLLAVFGLTSIATLTVIHCGLLAANSLTYFGIAGNLPAPPVQLGIESIQQWGGAAIFSLVAVGLAAGDNFSCGN
jgi:hypothetical protein